jgi:pyruvate/2-oxoglutarate dehydrogenase complex dihydrolipoamide dehydrogenase (E3) component
MAQAFARLGSQVTQIEMADRILPREDPDVSEEVSRRFKSEGLRCLVKTKAEEVIIENGEKFLICRTADGQTERIAFDEILVAVGRRANTANQGLEKLGIELNANGTIAVDSYMRTTRHKNIFACGDVVGPYQFTHVAAHQAWFCAVNALFFSIQKVRCKL